MCISFVYTVLYLVEKVFKIHKIYIFILNVSDCFLNVWELHKIETANKLLYLL